MKDLPSPIHCELLLRMMEHLLTLDQRERIMRELPEAYNAMVGWIVVRSILVTDAPTPEEQP